MNINEIEVVSSLEPYERYKYFIKRIADAEKIYSLKDVNGEEALSTVRDIRFIHCGRLMNLRSNVLLAHGLLLL